MSLQYYIEKDMKKYTPDCSSASVYFSRQEEKWSLQHLWKLSDEAVMNDIIPQPMRIIFQLEQYALFTVVDSLVDAECLINPI